MGRTICGFQDWFIFCCAQMDRFSSVQDRFGFALCSAEFKVQDQGLIFSEVQGASSGLGRLWGCQMEMELICVNHFSSVRSSWVAGGCAEMVTC
ncbi:hypothetical protein AVEN_149467-1 [Araneus ventricosus]|uniref:Uncharacterized protein n=1 Tax=Araneus ventricosus TaxID=182803 RepID=A0A4Y2N1N5_ARAVE|nr:hypothetical protein AVEN_149467-1 [Araneus ventricosus]